jgi:hypothetical protein
MQALSAKRRSTSESIQKLTRNSGAVLVYGIILATTILQLFAIPGTGVIGLGLVVGLAVFVWAVLEGYLRVDPWRMCAYLIALSALAATMVAKATPFSFFSFLMLATIYLPFIAVAATDRLGYLLILNAYQQIAVFVAACGIAQFAFQFALGAEWMFPFHAALPESFFIPLYNLRIPIADGLPYLKSTGLWFLEPSLFSQALALAILIEVLYFRRLGILTLFGAAYITSFSGTGALLLLAVAAPLLVRLRHFWPLLMFGAAIAAMPALSEVPPFSFFIDRLAEFGHPLSSGSMRFLAPFWFTREHILNDPTIMWFGLGPGSTADTFLLPDYAVQDTFWLKLLLEYGLVGGVPFTIFYTFVLFYKSPDKIISFAFLVQSMFLGGYLNSYFVQFLMLALVGWPKLVREEPVYSLGKARR